MPTKLDEFRQAYFTVLRRRLDSGEYRWEDSSDVSVLVFVDRAIREFDQGHWRTQPAFKEAAKSVGITSWRKFRQVVEEEAHEANR